MHSQKAPFFTRLGRLFRLAGWLFRTGRHLRRIDAGNPAERDYAVITLGKGALEALDIELEIGTPPADNVNGALVAANHVSWLDIFAMSAVYPSSFIAKQEIKNWPVLGKMGQNAGTVFINRNSRRDVEPINQAICAALKAGQNVSFFPEARTSLGLDILSFKAALFQSAIDADAPVQAVTLRYYDDAGKRTTVPSYAQVDLVRSLWRIVSMKKLRIRIDFASPIRPGKDEDRFMLKDKVESSIREVVLSDAHDSEK